MALSVPGVALGLTLCIVAQFVTPTSANVFLSKDLPHLNLHSGNLLMELERVLGAGHRADAEARAEQLEEKLRPTFSVLPRDKDDRLEPAAVRYLLHRMFVDRHGWFVLGFDTEGEAWNSSSPTAVLGQHENFETQEIFEDKLGARGLSLHEVALLAATLESFVHVEATERLHGAYRVLNLSRVEDHAKESDVVHALDTYMLMYVLGVNHASVTALEMDDNWASIYEVYPTWNETKKWIHEVRKEVLSSSPETRDSFNTTLRVVEAIADRYGRWQDKECVQIKEDLMKLEQPGIGRVPLSTFYEAALNGQWQFSESKEYLRQLGILDETNPARPSVMISNYVNSPANCVASSKFYSVCCINECESLLAHMEKQVAAPAATVSRIVEVVEQLPSATVETPRKLPAQLLERLDQIASHHGGVVPFHARLFNQWLHHAYPRECPYPHMSGTSKQISPEKWMEQTGEDAEADKDTMRWHVEEGRKHVSETDEFEQELPWSAEEELFIGQVKMELDSEPQEAAVRSSPVLRGLAFVGIACAMSVTLIRSFLTVQEGVALLPKTKVAV